MHPGRGWTRFFHLYFLTHTILPIMAVAGLRHAVLARGDFSHAWRANDEHSYKQWVSIDQCWEHTLQALA